MWSKQVFWAEQKLQSLVKRQVSVYLWKSGQGHDVSASHWGQPIELSLKCATHAQGLKTQEHIRNVSRAFVDGVREAGLSEEEVEQIWLKVLSPVAAELFQGQMEDFRAQVSRLQAPTC